MERARVVVTIGLVAGGLAIGCARKPQAVLEYEPTVTITTAGPPSTIPAAPPPPSPSQSRGGWRKATDK